MARESAGIKIGELARRTGLTVRTLRYYGQIGLLPEHGRTESGYRLYSPGDEAKLRFVLRAKRIGFTLDEIREMVQRSGKGSPCRFVKATLDEHLARLEFRIAELRKIRMELKATAQSWQQAEGSAGATVCGLIEGWSESPRSAIKEKPMARQIEVFTAGCPLCEPVVEMVRQTACSGCEVIVHSLREGAGAQRAREAGVLRVPMVLVDGKPAPCCQNGAITVEGLRAAGVGAG